MFAFVSPSVKRKVLHGGERNGPRTHGVGACRELGDSRRSFSPGCLVALGAREVEDDLLGLVIGFLFGDDVGMQKLVRHVGENSGPVGRDGALGHQDEEPSKIFAKVVGGGEISAAGEEISREVGGIIGSARKDDRRVAQTEMMRAEARLGWQAGLAALLAVGVTVLTA